MAVTDRRAEELPAVSLKPAVGERDVERPGSDLLTSEELTVLMLLCT